MDLPRQQRLSKQFTTPNNVKEILFLIFRNTEYLDIFKRVCPYYVCMYVCMYLIRECSLHVSCQLASYTLFLVHCWIIGGGKNIEDDNCAWLVM